MKTTAYNPNAISTIVNFGETVYNENGKAVFVTKGITEIDLDNDDQIAEFMDELTKFNEALAQLGHQILKEVKDGHFLTDMPFESYSCFAGLTKEEINDINIVSVKIDEMVSLYEEANEKKEALNKRIESGEDLDDLNEEADVINKLVGLVYNKWMWIYKKDKALVAIDSERFGLWEAIGRVLVIPYKKVLEHIVKRYQLSVC